MKLAWGALSGLGLALAFLVLCTYSLSGDWASFFSWTAAEKIAEFATGFLNPAMDATFLRKLAYATLETLAISWLGTLIACVFGLLVALPASGRWGHAPRAAARLLLNVLRAIPELVWAVMAVIAVGLGPFAGTLALAVHTTGVLGRLFADSLENVPPDPYASLRRHGIGAVTAFWYSTFPQVIPQLMSYSMYRWEINVRAAAILGVVGAGGLGQMLHFHFSLFQTSEAASVLVAMIVLVAVVDALSNYFRGRMIA